MADETQIDLDGGEDGGAVEMRPCAYCGHSIHPSSHRCTYCGGHVGLAWGTVHKELFLFLFLAVMVVVGCLSSWTGRTPAASAKQLEKAQDAAAERAKNETDASNKEVDRLNVPRAARGEAPLPYASPVAPKVLESDIEALPGGWDSVEPAGSAMNGLDSIRGVVMLAIAVYALFVGVFNLIYRRLVMWPFVISGMLALWVGLGGVISASKSSAWDRWNAWGAKHSLDEQYLAKLRAIPPGFILLTLAGIILLIKLIGGILAVATKGKPGDGSDGDRRRRKSADAAATSAGASGAAGAAGTPPTTPAK